MRAVMRGFTKEDISQGHSLMADSAARMIQLQFVTLAAKHLDTLRKVLRTSSDADHRALAAEVIAYNANKAAVVGDLVYAMRDPSTDVRNNATRALALIALYGQQHPELKITVPYEPFIDLLNSLTWTDRNKASLALMELTEKRRPDAAFGAQVAGVRFDRGHCAMDESRALDGGGLHAWSYSGHCGSGDLRHVRAWGARQDHRGGTAGQIATGCELFDWVRGPTLTSDMVHLVLSLPCLSQTSCGRRTLVTLLGSSAGA